MKPTITMLTLSAMTLAFSPTSAKAAESSMYAGVTLGYSHTDVEGEIGGEFTSRSPPIAALLFLFGRRCCVCEFFEVGFP
jgi:hypothetical protein